VQFSALVSGDMMAIQPIKVLPQQFLFYFWRPT